LNEAIGEARLESAVPGAQAQSLHQVATNREPFVVGAEFEWRDLAGVAVHGVVLVTVGCEVRGRSVGVVRVRACSQRYPAVWYCGHSGGVGMQWAHWNEREEITFWGSFQMTPSNN